MRKTFQMRKLSEKRSIDFGVKPFKKGLVGIEGAKPLICTGNRHSCFFTTKKAFQFSLSPLGDPKYCSKPKSVLFGSGFQRGALSCRAPLSCETIPRIVSQFTPRRAHCVSVRSRKRVRIFSALGVRAPFEKGAPKLFLTLSGGDFGKSD